MEYFYFLAQTPTILVFNPANFSHFFLTAFFCGFIFNLRCAVLHFTINNLQIDEKRTIFISSEKDIFHKAGSFYSNYPLFVFTMTNEMHQKSYYEKLRQISVAGEAVHKVQTSETREKSKCKYSIYASAIYGG